MDVQVKHDPEDLRFFAEIGGEEAELTYNYLEEDLVDFDYTFVPEGARNQGVSDQLVKAGLSFARSQELKVIPSCPVVEAYVKRHPEFCDLLR